MRGGAFMNYFKPSAEAQFLKAIGDKLMYEDAKALAKNAAAGVYGPRNPGNPEDINFLVKSYLEKRFPSGGRRRATRRHKRAHKMSRKTRVRRHLK